jgi:hypothetical protein
MHVNFTRKRVVFARLLVGHLPCWSFGREDLETISIFDDFKVFSHNRTEVLTRFF